MLKSDTFIATASMTLPLLLRRGIFLLPVMAGMPELAADRTTLIHVVLDDNYPHYNFRDTNGQAQGILKNLWERTVVAAHGHRRQIPADGLERGCIEYLNAHGITDLKRYAS